MAANGYVAIPGSEREPLPGATKTRPCDPTESVQVTVVLRPRPLGKNVKPLSELIASGERVTRSEYEARYGADPEEVKQVEEFARAHGLTVSERESKREDLEAHGDGRGLRQGVSSGLGSLSVPGGDLPGPHWLGVHSSIPGGRDRERSRPRQPASSATAFSPRVQWAVHRGAVQRLHFGFLHAAPGSATL